MAAGEATPLKRIVSGGAPDRRSGERPGRRLTRR